MAISLTPGIDNATLSFDNTYVNGKNSFGAPDNGMNLLVSLRDISVVDDGKPPASTPSVFRRPIDFYNVITLSSAWPELSQSFIGQWRKLVAMLALNELRAFNINFEKIPLDNPPATSTFLQTCASDIVLPQDSAEQFGNMTWKKSCYVIILDYAVADLLMTQKEQCVIGATTPKTLFFPVEDFDAILEAKGIRLALNTLTEEEQKCVLDWLIQFKVSNADSMRTVNITLKNMLDAFIIELQTLLGPQLSVSGWDPGYASYQFGYNSRFATGAFDLGVNSVGDGVEAFNFSVKKSVPEKEWRVLFTALALNDLKKLGLRLAGDKFVDKSSRVVAKWVNYCVIAPVEDAETHSYLLNNSIGDLTALTTFENYCVWQYLTKLAVSFDTATPMQLRTYISNHLLVLETALSQANVNPAAWESNRFKVRSAASDDPAMMAFNFTVNAYVAPFFEDYDGKQNQNAYGGPIAKKWFELLYIVALQNLRNINVQYSNTPPVNMFNINASNDSPLCSFSAGTGYMARSILMNGTGVAITSCDTLFEIIGEAQAADVIDNIYESFIVPGNDVLKRGMRGVGNGYLFEHEIVLLIQYLRKVRTLITPNGGTITPGRDVGIIDGMIADEINRLAGLIPHVRTPEVIDIERFYSIPDFVADMNSTTRFFYGCIEDNLFERTLILYDADLGDMVKRIKNHGGRAGDLGVVYMEQDGSFVPNNKGSILPFIEPACEKMYHANVPSRNINDAAFKTTLWYGLDYVETYTWAGLLNGKQVDVYDVYCKDTSTAIPFVKRFYYAKDDAVLNSVCVRDSGAINIIPSVTVWPDVEIECWNEYYVNVVNLGEGYASTENVSLPEFLQPTRLGRYGLKNKVNDIHYVANNEENSVDISFTSYTTKTYPRMLRFKLDGENNASYGGCIFTRAVSTDVMADGTLTEDVDSYISDASLMSGAQYKTALVGVDFGTTNSTAYFASGYAGSASSDSVAIDPTSTPTPLSMLSIESNFLTIPRNLNAADMAREITEVLVSQRRWIYDSNNLDSFSSFTSTLALYARAEGGRDLGSGPFVTSNIYRMGGSEIANYDKSIMKNTETLRYGMKWDSDATTVQARENFLKQFALVCCVNAVKKCRAKWVEIRASYTTSLTNYLVGQYERFWENICSELGPIGNETSGITGLRITHQKLASESLCSGLTCVYDKDIIYASGNNAYGRGLVCIDIGGGSTDIAVLQGDTARINNYNLVSHLSLPFAAQYAFTAGDGTISFFRALFKQLDDDYSRAIMNDPKGSYRYKTLFSANTKMLGLMGDSHVAMQDRRKFKLMMDTFIANIVEIIKERAEGNKNLRHFLERINLGDNSNDKKWLSKVKMVALSMLHFTGLMLRKLIEDGKYTLHYEKSTGYVVDVFLAGNGSRMFDWVCLDGDGVEGRDTDAKINNLFALYIKDALIGLKDFDETAKLTVNLNKSLKPKREAAHGLLYVRPDSDNIDVKKSSFDVVDIDAIIYEFGMESHEEFRRKLLDGLSAVRAQSAAPLVSNDEFSEKSDIEAYDYLTKAVNPSFDDENLAGIVSGFLESFAKFSPVDFDRVFPGIIAPKETRALNDKEKADIADVAELSIPFLREPVNKGLENVLPIAVRSFNGYAVLKFVTNKLCETL